MIKVHRVEAPKTTPYEYYPITATEVVVLGEALKFASGKLTKASGTDVPEFIAMASATGDAAGEIKIPVLRVLEDIIFETEFSADATAVTIGSKVTLATDGTKVTATTTSGTFTIIEKLGTGAIGTKVRGLFRR